jgi:hypothetical protein
MKHNIKKSGTRRSVYREVSAIDKKKHQKEVLNGYNPGGLAANA